MMEWLNSLSPQVLKWALIIAVILDVCLLLGLVASLRNRYPLRKTRLPHVRPFVWSPKDETALLLPKPITGPQLFEHVMILDAGSHPFDPMHCPECARLELRLGKQVTYPGQLRIVK